MARTTITRTLQLNQKSPRLSITHILKRRKKTLKHWANELGLTTLSNAKQWCEKMGVCPPTIDEWKTEIADPELPPLVNDPSGGVVVLENFIDNPKDTEENPKTIINEETKPKSLRRRKKVIDKEIVTDTLFEPSDESSHY